MLEMISESLYRWTEIHGEERNEDYPWNSYVIHFPDKDILALVDPLAMSEEVAAEIESLKTPTHIVLTCEYHLRESVQFRKRWGCEISVNINEQDKYEVEIDETFRSGEKLFGCIDLVDVQGSFYPETALLIYELGGILIIGDKISGGRKDCGIPDGELGLAFPEWIPDLLSARRNLRKLLDLDFRVICSGHGLPVLEEAKSKLKAYVESDQVWNSLENAKDSRGARVAD